MDGIDEGADARSKGGRARAGALTPERRSEIARLGGLAKATKHLPRATHEGILRIGTSEIGCAVLENGQRVLSQSSMMRALGRARQAKGRGHYTADADLPAFITAQNLKPFISNDLHVSSSQVEFLTGKGARAFGYAADLLPLVCEVYADAHAAGVLTHMQIPIARRARMLYRGLTRVGIAGLIDEATGYHAEHALQAILDKFLARELAAWAKRFPDEFYTEMFRLKHWDWKPTKGQRPMVVAKYTKDLVYLRLMPDLLKHLEARNPPDEKGNRRGKHHQWLSDDVGHPALAQHLHAVIALMRATDSWADFKRLLDRALPVKTRVEDLPLFNQDAASADLATAEQQD